MGIGRPGILRSLRCSAVSGKRCVPRACAGVQAFRGRLFALDGTNSNGSRAPEKPHAPPLGEGSTERLRSTIGLLLKESASVPQNGAWKKLSGMFLLWCGRKVLGNDLRKVGDGDFRLLDFRMPCLFPFERVVARIPDSGKKLDLSLYRNVAAAGENVIVLAACKARVFQVRVANVFSELPDGDRGVFLALHESVVRVPQQSDMRRSGSFKNLLQHRGGCEIAVRFKNDRNAFGSGVASQFSQRASDVLDGSCLRPDEFVAENADIGSAKPRSQVNETSRVGKLLLMFGPGVVHVGGAAYARNVKAADGDFFLGLFDLTIRKLGTGRQVHSP